MQSPPRPLHDGGRFHCGFYLAPNVGVKKRWVAHWPPRNVSRCCRCVVVGAVQYNFWENAQCNECRLDCAQKNLLHLFHQSLFSRGDCVWLGDRLCSSWQRRQIRATVGCHFYRLNIHMAYGCLCCDFREQAPARDCFCYRQNCVNRAVHDQFQRNPFQTTDVNPMLGLNMRIYLVVHGRVGIFQNHAHQSAPWCRTDWQMPSGLCHCVRGILPVQFGFFYVHQMVWIIRAPFRCE